MDVGLESSGQAKVAHNHIHRDSSGLRTQTSMLIRHRQDNAATSVDLYFKAGWRMNSFTYKYYRVYTTTIESFPPIVQKITCHVKCIGPI